ncbi:MAG: hypothetical protein ACFB0B_18205 [Thermonemataceae bacterium]
MGNLFLFVSFLLIIPYGTDTAFEIKDGDGKTVVTVQKDGSIMIKGEVKGHITEDGTFSYEEKIIAKMGESDMLVDAKGETLAKIDENGTIDNGSGVLIKWSESGELMKGDEKMGMKITPAEKSSFRNASIILFLYLSGSK